MELQCNQTSLASIGCDQVHQQLPPNHISTPPTCPVSCEARKLSDDDYMAVYLPSELQAQKLDDLCPSVNIEGDLAEKSRTMFEGLVATQNRCYQLVGAQGKGPVTLTEEQWAKLVAQHVKLQREYHAFFLTTQHTSATPAVQKLAKRYAMPDGPSATMELKRMFINLTYSGLFMLYKKVPTFESIWIECLGDTGRFLIAIVDHGLDLREKWKRDSQQWFSMASDRAPETGRLYHHLGAIAYPNVLEQLFYYSKSLCVSVPFLNSRDSITKLFSQHVNSFPMRPKDTNAAFLCAHYILFSGKNRKDLEYLVQSFVGHLDGHFNTGNEINNDRWLVSGYQIGISLGCAMLEYGSASNLIVRWIKLEKDGDNQHDDSNTFSASQNFLDAIDFAARTHNVVLRRSGNPNFYPYLHVSLSFLYHMSHFTTAMGYIEAKMPWKLISLMLNTLLEKCASVDSIESEDFPRPSNGAPRPLPEDFAQRGLLWVDRYYPDDWFTSKLDDDEKYLEVPSMTEERQDRCLWLGCRLASSGKWLTYDKSTRQFGVPSQYDIENPSVNAETPMQPASGVQTPTNAVAAQ